MSTISPKPTQCIDAEEVIDKGQKIFNFIQIDPSTFVLHHSDLGAPIKVRGVPAYGQKSVVENKLRLLRTILDKNSAGLSEKQRPSNSIIITFLKRNNDGTLINRGSVPLVNFVKYDVKTIMQKSKMTKLTKQQEQQRKSK